MWRVRGHPSANCRMPARHQGCTPARAVDGRKVEKNFSDTPHESLAARAGATAPGVGSGRRAARPRPPPGAVESWLLEWGPTPGAREQPQGAREHRHSGRSPGGQVPGRPRNAVRGAGPESDAPDGRYALPRGDRAQLGTTSIVSGYSPRGARAP